MQAIILAAGKGTRMHPLTEDTPKPLVEAAEKPLMEHNLEKLPSEITELIIVIGYLGEQIKACFGNSYNGRPITYVEQPTLNGTADAVSLCAPHITGRFMVLMGDDMYTESEMHSVLEHERAWLVKKVHGHFSGGRIIADANGTVTDVIEGTHDTDEAYVSTNLFVLTPEYFTYEPVPIKNGAEFGLPQTVVKMSAQYPVKVVEADGWKQITTANDVATLHQSLTDKGQ